MFVIVTMTVKNTGNEPRSYFASNQKLIDTAGREFAADTMADLNFNEESMVMNLNPGLDPGSPTHSNPVLERPRSSLSDHHDGVETAAVASTTNTDS